MTSTPLRNACSCGPMPTPPNTAAAVMRRVDREIVEVLEDLRRQLARRREDQRARRAARLADQLVQDRQQERRRLAAAGHRAGEHVPALERRRNRICLDRRRTGEPEILQTAEQVGVELELAEWHRERGCSTACAAQQRTALAQCVGAGADARRRPRVRRGAQRRRQPARRDGAARHRAGDRRIGRQPRTAQRARPAHRSATHSLSRAPPATA